MQTMIETVGSLLDDGARFLADLLGKMVDRLVGRFTSGLAGIALAFGCQEAETVEPVSFVPAPLVVEVAEPVVEPPAEPTPIGKFNITFYYVVGEEEITAKKKPVVVAQEDQPRPANDNQAVDETELASIAVPEQVTLYARNGSSCDPISEVSREFASQLRIQGTGKLRDGRVLNIWGHCPCGTSPCFKVTAAQWGTAGSGRQLHPFRTVAVDPKVIKLGSLLHVPLLEGRTMPGRAPWGGFVHDGCVVADDVGGGIKGHQLDLFVGRKGWFLGMSGHAAHNAWAKNIPVFDGSKVCERKGRNVTRRAGSS
jgi:3D (Asp-Asp-Asp) domain-containing protein